MLTGAWRNFDHLEEELSMQELVELVKAMRKREWDRFRMQASLKGIDVDKGRNKTEDDPVEAAKRRVALRRAQEAGMSVAEFDDKESLGRLQSIGFSVNKTTK